MGYLLAKPKTEKFSEDGGAYYSTISHYGLSSMQGWRKKMEDAHLALPEFSANTSLYAVFDGHGGPAVAHWISHHFADTLRVNIESLRSNFKAMGVDACFGSHETFMQAQSNSNNNATSTALAEARFAAASGGVKIAVEDDEAHRDTKEEQLDSLCGMSLWQVLSLREDITVSPTQLPQEVVIICEALQKTFLDMDALMTEPDARQEIAEIHCRIEEEEERGSGSTQSYSEAFNDQTMMGGRGIASGPQEDQSGNHSSELSRPTNVLEEYLSRVKAGNGGSRPRIQIASTDGVRGFAVVPPEASEKAVAGDEEDGSTSTTASSTDANSDSSECSVDTGCDDTAGHRNTGVDGSEKDSATCTMGGGKAAAEGGEKENQNCNSGVENGDHVCTHVYGTDGTKTSDEVGAISIDRGAKNDEAHSGSDGNSEHSTLNTATAKVAELADRAFVADVAEVAGRAVVADVAEVAGRADVAEVAGRADVAEVAGRAEIADTSAASGATSTNTAAAGRVISAAGEEEHKETNGSGGVMERLLKASGVAGGVGSGGGVKKTLPCEPEACGSAAIATVVCVCEGHAYLITANAGDSRAVLSRQSEAVPLSKDHKPELLEERRRIASAGGAIFCGRVDGNLNLSRTLGDLMYKVNTKIPPEDQKITALPDVRILPLDGSAEFAVIACDGIWDCLSNDVLVQLVGNRRTTILTEQRKAAFSFEGARVNDSFCRLNSIATSSPVSLALQPPAVPDYLFDHLTETPPSHQWLGPSTEELEVVSPVGSFEELESNYRLSLVCEEICDMCLADRPGETRAGIGCDNMTMMIVGFGSSLRQIAKSSPSFPVKRPSLYAGKLYKASLASFDGTDPGDNTNSPDISTSPSTLHTNVTDTGGNVTGGENTTTDDDTSGNVTGGENTTTDGDTNVTVTVGGNTRDDEEEGAAGAIAIGTLLRKPVDSLTC